MSERTIILDRTPQTDDTEKQLLGRILSGSYSRVGGYINMSAPSQTWTTGTAIQTKNARGIWFYLRFASLTGAGAILPRLEWQDPTSGNWARFAFSASSITASSVQDTVIYAGEFSGASGSGTAPGQMFVGCRLPNEIRLTLAVSTAFGGTDGYQGTVGYELV